jgi:hypothetical protein
MKNQKLFSLIGIVAIIAVTLALYACKDDKKTLSGNITVTPASATTETEPTVKYSGNDTIKKNITVKRDEHNKIMPIIYGRKILGYYKSPYENRIVVVVSHYHFVSFSGGYHTVGLDLFGCNMNIGL